MARATVARVNGSAVLQLTDLDTVITYVSGGCTDATCPNPNGTVTGGQQLKLNNQTSANKYPVVVYVVGSGFENSSGINGSALEQQIFEAWENCGYVVANVEYRVSGNNQANPRNVDLATQFADVLAALNWIQANIATYGGDPNRVAVVGNSSQMLQTILGLTTLRPVLTVGWSAGFQVDYTFGSTTTPSVVAPWFTNLIFASGFSTPTASLGNGNNDWYQVSINYRLLGAPVAGYGPVALGPVPRVLVCHGTADGTVPVWTARQFQTACQARGIGMDYLEFAGLGHIQDPNVMQTFHANTLPYLAKYLGTVRRSVSRTFVANRRVV